jgi:hypothetical protein
VVAHVRPCCNVLCVLQDGLDLFQLHHLCPGSGHLLGLPGEGKHRTCMAG